MRTKEQLMADFNLGIFFCPRCQGEFEIIEDNGDKVMLKCICLKQQMEKSTYGVTVFKRV